MLPRLWDSPGNNTAVGCYFLLQCMKVKSEREVAQSCPTLSDPMDCSSSVHGIFQARVQEWGAIAFSGLDLTGVVKSWNVIRSRLTCSICERKWLFFAWVCPEEKWSNSNSEVMPHSIRGGGSKWLFIKETLLPSCVTVTIQCVSPRCSFSQPQKQCTRTSLPLSDTWVFPHLTVYGRESFIF